MNLLCPHPFTRSTLSASVAVLFTFAAISAKAQLSEQAAENNLLFSSDDLTMPTFAPESDNDDDLGMQLTLQPNQGYDPFTLFGDIGWYFTDNAQVTNDGVRGGQVRDDQLLRSSVTLSYLPIIASNLYGEVTLRESTFRYQRDSSLDFDTVDAGAGFIYVVRGLGDLSLFTRYNYGSYLDPHADWTRIYENHSIQAGFYKPWLLARNHFVYASYTSDISFDAEPGYAQRDDHSLTFGYRYTPSRKIKIECFGRSAFLDYHQNSREDWNHTIGSALTYNITRHFHLSTSVSYTYNESSVGYGDYEVWMPGIRLGGIMQF